MLPNLLYQTATIERQFISATGTPSYGYTMGDIDSLIDYADVLSDTNNQPVKVWSTLATVSCRLEDVQSKVIEDGKLIIITERICYMPNTDLLESDRVIVDDVTYYLKKVLRAAGMRAIDHIEAVLVQKDKS